MHDTTDPVANLQALVACPSLTPAEGGALALLESMLVPLGFSVERPVFATEGTPDVENLYARHGRNGPNLMYAGHTDVVPPGRETAWTHPPFAGTVANGELFGRGAVDMKGSIACFVSALARLEAEGRLERGSVSLVITGDEEGPSINGTSRLLEWATDRGERFDAALVGEPSNRETLGDMIKIGRRGSISGRVTVEGVQGHVAYPHLADNPIPGLLALLSGLIATPLDEGTDSFPASNLEVTTIDVGNPSTNVIPASVSAGFNIRFCDVWDGETIATEIERRLAAAAEGITGRGERGALSYRLDWVGRISPVFLTRDDRLVETLAGAVERTLERTPELSTTGGTSDARFIKDYCPVVEFGLVGQTMHKVDERVPLSDLEALTRVYMDFIVHWFA
ncbi:succinyl-diaminopimelate desuccinylase [Pararhizobium mangrovi]|uniref:Succinyl-diaminopimelate desuccinylase n=1 Tax=Pararhizobium mangrovi TaxID=2590452 RepID=A0A506U5V4_9HYPH|nr:succinyl-diaminopimelate desuccinylase [Pararhizobium mangrovi]TPW28736.1 succinyl-diaminopimelate desuccinylase [Pararhizobium mangrovi]